MELTEKQINLINNNLIILSTSSLDNIPRAIIVHDKIVKDDKIIIADNEMQITRNNLLSNKNAFILVCSNNYDFCLKYQEKLFTIKIMKKNI